LCLLLQLFARLEFHGDWRKKLTTAVEFASAHIGKLIALFVLVTALVLTHSRGGLLATLAGLAALMVAISTAPSLGRLRRIGTWGVVPFVVFLIALFISGGGTFDRMMSADFDSAQRLTVYRLILQAIGDYPVFGIGLGSFADIFPIYRSSSITAYFDLAHNDYLQNILELGIPAALCLFAAVGWLVGLCVRGIRARQRDAIYPCLAVAASVLVGLHAAVDFSLQIPAVTVTYMFLLGIGVAQSRSSRRL
jgi:O-antigen ligase